MKDMYISLSSGGGKITDIESTGDNFIRFKNGYQICWGLEISSNMDHGSSSGGSGGGDLDGGIMGNGGGNNSGTNSASFGDNSSTIYGGTKTFTFPVPFIEIPYIAISPASGKSYKTSNDGTANPPTVWYHDESAVCFTAELSTAAVKLTWIAIGKWK